MKIGELARRSGLSASRIRFYEASGLIATAERQANGYREYGPDTLLLLDIITSAQAAGFTLDEIRSLLPVDGQAQPKAKLLTSLRRKVGEIEQLQQKLERSKAQLLAAIDSIDRGPEGAVCADRARWVLERARGMVAAPQAAPIKGRLRRVA